MESYPARIDIESPDEIERWRPLVQWIMAIPHLIIAGAMEYVTGAVAVVSWFVILFTGRLPAGLANFQVMILRYTTRAEVYAGFLHDTYPPFEFAMSTTEPGGTPVDLTVEPALEDRNRLTVGLRLIWAIPAILYRVRHRHRRHRVLVPRLLRRALHGPLAGGSAELGDEDAAGLGPSERLRPPAHRRVPALLDRLKHRLAALTDRRLPPG